VENNQAEVRLSPHELEILENFDQARHVQQMMHMEGWKIFLRLRDERIKELERQFWAATPRMDRDATWVAAMRKEAIVSFLNLWIAEIEQKIECLDPEVMQRIIDNAKLNVADLDDDLILE
jgi:hypothetical protein